MAATEATFPGSGGLNIFYRAWRPEGTPRAVVVICHGVNSHGGQYLWAAERLVEHGFAVFALDLRGRGRSDGRRFYVEDAGDYASDVAGTIAIAKAAYPGLKLFLLGHSAGGVTGALYVLDHQHEIDGFICESFAFQVPAPAFALAIIKFLGKVVPGLGVLTLHNKDFSRDPAWVAALDADPYTQHEKQPAATVAALLYAADRMRVEFPTITIPLLILHGTEDKATMPAGSKFFYETAGSADKTLKLYEGHYHDLLADYGKESVMADITNWLEARS
ncbi:MAG: alpha/beta fold hydrolase [Sphingomonadales bacterium]|nr:MAG: alpha/beta fold hydrolase [Sphingomonadales bacterium]